MAIRIESKNAVVLGGDENNVVNAFAWDLQPGQIERLRVDVAK